MRGHDEEATDARLAAMAGSAASTPLPGSPASRMMATRMRS